MLFPEHGEHGNEEEVVFEHVVTAKMGERGRVLNLPYIEADNFVADIHFEIARITKRAAWSFELRVQDQLAHGHMRLRQLGDVLHFQGVARSANDRANSCPLSAMRRGGAASSVRAKMARKLHKRRKRPSWASRSYSSPHLPPMLPLNRSEASVILA